MPGWTKQYEQLLDDEGPILKAGPQEILYFRLIIRWPGLIWPKINIAIHHPDDNWPDMTYSQISKTERIYRFIPPSRMLLTKGYEIKILSKTFVHLGQLDAFRGALAFAQGTLVEKNPNMLDKVGPGWLVGETRNATIFSPPPMIRPPRH